ARIGLDRGPVRSQLARNVLGLVRRRLEPGRKPVERAVRSGRGAKRCAGGAERREGVAAVAVTLTAEGTRRRPGRLAQRLDRSEPGALGLELPLFVLLRRCAL